MTSVITAHNLGKKYILHHQRQEPYSALRDVLTNSIKTIARKIIHPSETDQQSSQRTEEFWAIRKISFDIKQGDRFGIIGRNGAGKSTLLKILSRITEPTSGMATIKGRVASLLEVGTGFHPELTGRENVFLNGAILGMSKSEIKLKFDEIVAFAEVEKFLDTPVKRFSSGMYVRLAFAIAAHLEPEILIVDEVLAVGDAQFQRKCMGKMEEVGKDGRTVLFVSHNMATIEKICSRCLFIDKGEIKLDASPKEAISAYYNKPDSSNQSSVDLLNLEYRGKSSMMLFRKIELKNEDDQPVNKIAIGGYLKIVVELQENINLDNMSFGFGIENESGERLFSSTSLMCNGNYLSINTAVSNRIEFTLRNVNLMPGQYSVNIAAVKSQREYIDSVDRAICFEIIPSDIYGTGKLPSIQQGYVYMPTELQIV